MPALVQQSAVTAATTLTLAGTGAGNTVIVGYGATGATTPTGVSVGSMACTLIPGTAETSATASSSLWIAVGVPAGQTAVTVTGGSSTSPALWAAEFSGMGSATVDKVKIGTASGSSWTSGATATTTSATEVWAGFAYLHTTASQGTPAITGAWTGSTGSSGSQRAAAGYQLVSSTGAATFSGSQTGTGVSYSASVATIAAGAVTLALPVARVAVAAYPPAPANGARTLALPVAGVTAAAYSLTPASGARTLTLPVARVAVAAYPPAPVYARTVALGTAQVSVAAHMVAVYRALLLSIAATAGEDDYGNSFPAGVTTFQAVTGQSAQLDQGAVSLLSDSSQFDAAGLATVPSLPGALGISSGQATPSDNPVNITLLSEAAAGVTDGQIQLIAGEVEIFGTLIADSLTLNGQVISVPQGAPPTIMAAPSTYNSTWGNSVVNGLNYLIAVDQGAGIIP
jgi:hypothetical protein